VFRLGVGEVLGGIVKRDLEGGCLSKVLCQVGLQCKVLRDAHLRGYGMFDYVQHLVGVQLGINMNVRLTELQVRGSGSKRHVTVKP
jgi:hypothetical protein